MRHIVCVVRHAQSKIQDDDGVKTDLELTRRGEGQAQRLALALDTRFGTRDMHIESSGAKRAMDTAKRVSEILNVKPVFKGYYLNLSSMPFNRELQRFLSSPGEWNGVHVLITHYAFIEASLRLANATQGFKSLTPEPNDFPYGSMVIIDVDEQTVEFSPNDQP
jgi:phosphohistidine phosphatase SixA